MCCNSSVATGMMKMRPHKTASMIVYLTQPENPKLMFNTDRGLLEYSTQGRKPSLHSVVFLAIFKIIL